MSVQQQQTECLINGYIRHYSTQTIPFALIKVIILFYDLWIYCILSKQDVIQLQKKDVINSVKYSTPIRVSKLIHLRLEFLVDNRTYKTSIPNVQETFIRPHIFIHSIPFNVSSFVILMEVQNETININCKMSYKLFMQSNEQRMISSANLPFNLGKITDLCLHNNNEFYFNFLFQIKDIKYNTDGNNNNKYNNVVNDNINMHKSCTFHWNIQGDLYTYLSKAKFRQLCSSPTFNNDCFFVSVYPQGWIYRPGISLFIGCVNIPQDITAIDVAIACIFNNKRYELDWTNVTHDAQEKCIFNMKQPIDMWSTGNFLCLCIEMKITNIYINKKLIDTTEWNKYGIIQ